MTHYYRKIKCPHCSEWIDQTRQRGVLVLTGSPFRVCPKCGKEYTDTAYTEDAIYRYEHWLEPELISFGWRAIVLTSIIIAALIGIVNDKSVLWLVIIVILIAPEYFCIKGVIHGIKVKTKPKEMEDEIIHVIETTKEKSIVESLERLSDKDYVTKLTLIGKCVPDYFLLRIGVKKEMENLRENLSEHEEYIEGIKEDKNKSDYDEMLEKQETWRSAKHLVRMGKKNKEFKELAQKMDMTEDELLAHCKSIIDDYDEIHRKYNETHAPIPYPEEYISR